MNGVDRERVVSVRSPELSYASGAPFDPPHGVYGAVEGLLGGLGLDRARRGTPEWNPLGDLVERGGSIAIKPNLVSSKNLHERIAGAKLLASSTHGSLLRPVLDYAARAVGPSGTIAVIDAPIEGCEIDDVVGPLGIRCVIARANRSGGPRVDFIDLRTFRVRPRMFLDDARRVGRSWNFGVLVRERLPGDPRGYRVIDLGEESFFARPGAPPGERLRFHRSHYTTPVAHHTGGKHEYSIPKTLLESDLLINLSKLKTHKKTGVTLSLKGVIGLTNEKYWLPHFTEGDDEFDRPQGFADVLEQKLSRFPVPGGHSIIARAPRVGRPSLVIDGSWEGNRTLYRTILDLVRVALYADRDGQVRRAPQRSYLTIVDGIVGGEGEGPLGATPVNAGILVAGFDPARVDAHATAMIGFDPGQIVHIVEGLREGFVAKPLRWTEGDSRAAAEQIGDARRFVAPRAWPKLSNFGAR